MSVYVTGVPSVRQSGCGKDYQVKWGHYVEAQALIASHFRQLVPCQNNEGLSPQEQTQQDVRRASFAVVEDNQIVTSSTLYRLKDAEEHITERTSENTSRSVIELQQELAALKQKILQECRHLNCEEADVAANLDF